jgi:5-(carboxyamino)imidazole ribonucleotide synthase
VRVGILGGGQLGRMLALAGQPLGVSCVVLDPAEAAPAAAVAGHVRAAWDDPAALDRLAAQVDVVTWEFENVPVASARRLAERIPVYPPPYALEIAQDRLAEKRFFQEHGIATPPFEPVGDDDALRRAVNRIGLPAVLKTRREGYDGKGQLVLRNEEQLGAARRTLRGVPLILEGFVDFDRELSILGVRGRDGEVRFWPLVENVHRGGILHLSRAPAPALAPAVQQAAEESCRRVLDALDYVGVLAIELFDSGGTLLANEMAPRVHNSGHWTIEGAVTSQFENHLRAVCGLPLGGTEARGHAGLVNIIGRAPDSAEVLRIDGAHLHLYGKAPRPGRKLGHVTITHDDAAELERRLARLTALAAQDTARP